MTLTRRALGADAFAAWAVFHKSPSVASGVQVVPRKAEEGVSLDRLSTDDNAARRRLGVAQ